MNLELYENVALRVDLPEEGLRQGDVVMLLDFVPHPQGGEDGCVVEVFNAVGESIVVTVVQKSQLEPLRANTVFSVRTLSQLSS